MAIDMSNPLLNGPRRVDARPVVRFTAPPAEEPHPDGPLFETAPGCLHLSEAQILAARTPAGSWTRETLAGWGVSWPPTQGWKQRLLDGQPQDPPRPKAAAAPTVVSPAASVALPAGQVPDWRSPDFDSTKHGLLAPPRVTYRKVSE